MKTIAVVGACIAVVVALLLAVQWEDNTLTNIFNGRFNSNTTEDLNTQQQSHKRRVKPLPPAPPPPQVQPKKTLEELLSELEEMSRSN